MGEAGAQALLERYLGVREDVAAAFDSVFVEPAAQGAPLPLANGPNDASGPMTAR